MRVARFFNTTAEFQLDPQTAYDLRTADDTLRPKAGHEVPPIQAGR